MSASPGWYPDPAGSPQQRWWDGMRWTEQLSAPAFAPGPYATAFAPPPRAPEGTSPQTVWIWLLVLLPCISVIPMFFVDLRSIFETAYQGALIGDAASSLAIYTEPAYLAVLGISTATMLVSIGLAVLDWRALTVRGVPRPFHWAFIFLVFAVGSLPYVIGRDVVARRRTGRWSGAAWVAIALTAVGTIAVIAYLAVQFQSVLALMANR